MREGTVMERLLVAGELTRVARECSGAGSSSLSSVGSSGNPAVLKGSIPVPPR
jgi:hypothetical protein